MPSPFPGMNPFLEQSDAWEDFHSDFISRAREMLAGEVSDNYLVKIETRMYVHELSSDERRHFGRADVSVSGGHVTRAASPSTGALAAPLEMSLPATDFERYTWLEIRDRRSRRLITVIELVSPTNKTPGPDRDDYLGKRTLELFGPQNFIEIDLRRGGTRPSPPVLPPCDYYVLLSRVDSRPKIGIWPMGLPDRLPDIPVPLAPPDPDVHLDLQAVLHRVYDAAHYGNYIYSDTPEPPLTKEQAEWAKQFIPQSSPPA